MKKKPTVTIGIPAYNEGSNIRRLLRSLFKQKQDGFVLLEIIVANDGSSDNTVRQVMQFKSARRNSKKIKAEAGKCKITLINDGKRLGKSARLQQIFDASRGELIFVMDADIVISDTRLISVICKNVPFKKAGLVGVNATPLPPVSLFETYINSGVTILKDIARQWQNGNNYLSFKGCFLGLEAGFAKSLSLGGELVSNDAYLYFSAISKGYSPVYIDSARIYYRSPKSFADHLKQSSRYRSIKEEMSSLFPSAPETEPKSIMIRSTFKYLLKEPVPVSMYIAIRLLTKIMRKKHITSQWDTALSTKNVQL